MDPGKGLGRDTCCFEFRATLGPRRLFGVQVEGRVLDQNLSAY